jgi:hypothetical protein
VQRPPEGRALRGGRLFRQGVLLEEESSIFTLKGRAALKRVDMDEAERSELAHLLLSRRVLYTETPPPRPGSRADSKDRTTRSGSLEAMAAAKKSKRARQSSLLPGGSVRDRRRPLTSQEDL